MKKPKDQQKQRKGAALIVAILLASIIGSAAIGVTAIAYRQVNIAETYNNGLVAYYAAESGLEQGLLYNKYDKNAEIPGKITPANSTLMRQPKNAYRNFMNELNVMRKPLADKDKNNDGVTGTYSPKDRVQVYDLQSYYKQAFVGDDKNGDGTITGKDLEGTTDSKYQITKDNAMAFTINTGSGILDDIDLFWKWVSPCNGKSRAVEIKLKDSTENEHTSLFQDPTAGCPAIANAEDAPRFSGGAAGVYVLNDVKAKMGITALTITEMTLIPVGGLNDGIFFGFTQGPIGKRNTSGLSTTIKSTGYFAGNSRQITANIDRQTGTVSDIFNSVIHKGK